MAQPSWYAAGNKENGGKLLFRFAGYAALSVALMVLDSRLEAVQYIRQKASVALYPVQMLSNQPVRLYRYLDNLAQSQSGLIAQNRLLLEENSRLKTRLQRDEVNLIELNELRKLYGLRQAGIRNVTGAEVISSGKDPLSDKLIVDKGSSDGLKAGDAVIDQNGLIGRITQALPYSSEITLLFSNQSIVPVMVARTGERSLLYGSGSNLDLRYFPAASDLKAGDVLLTSGLDGVYPAGIPVAKVLNTARSSGSPYYTVSLSPFAALRGSRFVLAVSRPDSEQTEP